MNEFINGIEVPELTQEQMNTLIERRIAGGHQVMQNGDSFSVARMIEAIEVYKNKHTS